MLFLVDTGDAVTPRVSDFTVGLLPPSGWPQCPLSEGYTFMASRSCNRRVPPWGLDWEDQGESPRIDESLLAPLLTNSYRSDEYDASCIPIIVELVSEDVW